MTTGYTLCADCRAWGTAAVRLCNKHADTPDLLAALEMAAEWIDNLISAVGQRAAIDAMPNNSGGRLQMRRALDSVGRLDVTA